ncbi:hypothetical protein NUSPORA_02866 [Nucleospora cyclopteri]
MYLTFFKLFTGWFLLFVDVLHQKRVACKKKWKKLPKNILLVAKQTKFVSSIGSCLDYECKDKKYDLLIYVDNAFRLELKHPYSISDAEIWFERGDCITEKVFNRAIEHYSQCEIRNGK